MMRWLTIALFLCTSASCWSATYYVSHHASASDANGGTNATTDAWATIQKGLDTVTAGNTLAICADSAYAQTVTVDVDTNSGTPSSPIVITGAASDGTIDGTRASITNTTGIALFSFTSAARFLEFRNMSISKGWGNTVVFSQPKDCVFENIDYEASSSGVRLIRYADSVFVKNCLMTDTSGSAYFAELLYRSTLFLQDCDIDAGAYGIYSNSGSVNVSVNRCKIKGGTAALYFSNADTNTGYNSLTVTNSLIYESGAGVQVGGWDTIIVDSTIVDCSGSGIVSNNIAGAVLNIENCIIAFNGRYGIDQDATWTNTDVFENGNFFYSNTSGDLRTGSISATSSNADPLFVDRSGDDYSLGIGSPALGLTRGYAGFLSYPDAGAQQLQPSGGSTVLIIVED